MMQTIIATTATSVTSTSVTSTSATAMPDAASWQDAVSQATGEATDVASAARPEDPKPPAKSGDKTAVPDTAAKLAAAAQPVFSATEKTLSQHSKKPAALQAGATTAQVPQHTKDTAKQAVGAVVQPVVASVADPSQPNTTPGTSKTDAGKTDAGKIESSQTDASKIATGKIDAGTVTAATPAMPAMGTPTVAALPDITASATPPAGQSNITPASKPASTAHAATLPQTGSGGTLLAAATTSAAAIATPGTAPLSNAMPNTVAPQSVTATNTDKSTTTRVVATAMASVNAASSNKIALTTISPDDAPALPVTPADKTDENSDKPTIGALPVTTSTLTQTTATAQPAAVAASGALPVIQPSTAGLAAAVTAMHQAGQSGAVLRLDPPGLGTLSVHVGLAQNGQVNVLFIPSTQDASTALQNNLSGLGAALAQSGITLGQAQVGGQFNQNAGQGGYQPPASQTATPQIISFDADTFGPGGVSAYA